MKHTFTLFGSMYYMLLAVIVGGMVATGVGAQNRPAMVIAFESDEVKVSGATHGGEVVALGLGIGRYNHMPLLTRDAIAKTDEDRDGVVVFRPYLFVTKAVWAAVDVQTGNYVLAPPAGVLPVSLPLA